MAWEEVGGFVRFIKCKECAVDQHLVEGVYLGKANNQYGEYHKYRANSGELVGIRGGHLDYLMENVKPNTKCLVIYRGSHILEDGPFRGKESHRFGVFTDGAAKADEFNPEEFDLSELGEL